MKRSRKMLYRSATGTAMITTAAISDCQDEDQQLRDERDDKRVAKRGEEYGIVDRSLERRQADDVQRGVPGRRVAEGVQQGQYEREAHERHQVDDRGHQHERPENPLALQQIAPGRGGGDGLG